MDRRIFLTQVVPAAGVVLVARDVMAAAPAAPDFVTQQLAPDLTLVTGAGGNVIVFRSSEGVLMVDGGAREHSSALLRTIQGIAGTDRVHTLFNTHCHADQTGSNVTLGAAGTRIIAHENTRLWLTTDVESKWESRIYPPLPKSAQPNQTFYTTGSLEFGGEKIDYGHLGQAHTDGDIYVFFRKANVLVAGDVVSVGSYPIVDYCTNGWIGGVVTALNTVVELSDANTKIIPGKGQPQTRDYVKGEQTTLNTIKSRLSKLMAQGKSAREMIEEKPAEEFRAQWGDPELLIRNSYPGMAHRAGELGVSIV